MLVNVKARSVFVIKIRNIAEDFVNISILLQFVVILELRKINIVLETNLKNNSGKIG